MSHNAAKPYLAFKLSEKVSLYFSSLYAFDLSTTQQSWRTDFHPTTIGGMYKLNVDFNTSIPLNLTLVAFSEFDSTISVNKQSQISKSYTTG